MNKGLTSYSLPEFLKKKYDYLYVLDPLLPVGGVGLIHGKGGHGKTQWAFTLADAVSSGTKFLDKFPVKEGKVLYLQLDMPENLFQSRWKKAIPELKAPENIVVVPYKPLDILKPDYQEVLKQTFDYHDPMLVFVDTLRKLHYEDENDNAVPMQVLQALKDTLGPNRASLVIHHDRKSLYVNKSSKRDSDNDEYDSPEELVETFRGARAWIDDSDLGVHLYKFGKSNRVKMSYSKYRCEPPPIMFLELDKDTLLIKPKGPETAREWAAFLFSFDPDINTTAWIKEVASKSGTSRQRASQVVAELVAEMTQ